MSLPGRIESLKRRHADLDLAIQNAQARLGTRDADLARLKRQKLSIKDEMQRLRDFNPAATASQA